MSGQNAKKMFHVTVLNFSVLLFRRSWQRETLFPLKLPHLFFLPLLLPSWHSTHLLYAPLDSDDMRFQSPWQPAGLVTISTFLSLIPAPFICIEITFRDEWVVPSSPNLCLSESSEHLICVHACLYQHEHSPRDVNDEADSVEELIWSLRALGLILISPLAVYFYYTHISSNNLTNKRVMT